MPEKKHPTAGKSGLHPRNKHRERYDFPRLIASCPELGPFVRLNEYNDESIDFFDPEAVKMLNKALLKFGYGVDGWDIPPGYLCPPIPGRADYIHYLADLLRDISGTKIPTGDRITCLDIGVGANGVYPLIGMAEYGWSFIGADLDPVALASVSRILEANPRFKGKLDLRLQLDPQAIFRGIIRKNEFIELTMCNPPFHASAEEARSGTVRKLSNLKQPKTARPVLNFGGQNNELWCEGGEERFVRDMILQSKAFAGSCLWFSTLISRESHLKNTYKTLKQVAASDVRTIPMGQGNKISRIVAWTFLTREQQEQWMAAKWK